MRIICTKVKKIVMKYKSILHLNNITDIMLEWNTLIFNSRVICFVYSHLINYRGLELIEPEKYISGSAIHLLANASAGCTSAYILIS